MNSTFCPVSLGVSGTFLAKCQVYNQELDVPDPTKVCRYKDRSFRYDNLCGRARTAK